MLVSRLIRWARRAVVGGACCVIAATTASAQAMTGSVRDSASGEPIEGVAVGISDTEGARLALRITDASGSYRLSLPDPGRCQVVRALGAAGAYDVPEGW